MFGFDGVNEYYKAATLTGSLDRIATYTLSLCAEDDIFSPGDAIPTDEAERSEKIAIITTRFGGHMGYCLGCWPSGLAYSDHVFVQYMRMMRTFARKAA